MRAKATQGDRTTMSEDVFGLLFLLFYLLALPAGIGAFAQGATGLAVAVVLSIAIPMIALLAPMPSRASTPTPRI